MKHLYTTALFTMSLLSALNIVAQTRKPTHMLRIQEDNDALNVYGEITDRSYTNGSRIDYFQSSRLPRFLKGIIPTSGDSSIQIDGWGLAQYMVTPKDISTSEHQPDDYPYAGSLVVTRSFLSFNPVKEFSYQSEFLIGVRGKYSMAKELQTVVHANMNYPKPRGWHNQLDNQLLINFTFTAEKNLFSWRNVLELNGGIQTRVGSFIDAVLVYPMLRIGKMSPYFNGFLSSHASNRKEVKQKLQYYLVVKPTASFVAYNAMLKGERTNAGEGTKASNSLSHYMSDVQFGAVIAYHNISFSYLQTHTSSYDKGLYNHSYGTMELCVRW